jgi:hypothetical protein
MALLYCVHEELVQKCSFTTIFDFTVWDCSFYNPMLAGECFNICARRRDSSRYHIRMGWRIRHEDNEWFVAAQYKQPEIVIPKKN